MTLDNLVGLGLEVIMPDAGAIKKLLAAAARNRRDAGITQLSNESRFDTAYKGSCKWRMPLYKPKDTAR